MAARGFLWIFGVIGVLLSVCRGLELNVAAKNIPLGGTIVITCTSKLDYESVTSLKKAFPEDVEKPYVSVADNNILVVPFKHISRYVMAYNPLSGDMYEFILTISDAVVEDSGNFTCSTSESDKKMVSVNVVVPPESVDMTLGTVDGPMHIISDGVELKFDGGEHRRVICNVHGGNPAPRLRVMAGDTDITNEFIVSKVTVREPTNDKGLVILQSSITAEAPSLPMKGVYAGKKIACIAEAAVEGVEPISVGFMAKFSGYKPKIECYDTLISYVHQTNVNITCKVTARPRPEKIYFYYYLQHTNSTVEIQPGMSQGHYRAEILDVSDDEDLFMMVLFIDRVFPQMFRHYYFVADGSFGQTEHAVYLERDQSRETTDSDINRITDRSRETIESDVNRIRGVAAVIVFALVAPLLSYL
jgi:hypothetical protein